MDIMNHQVFMNFIKFWILNKFSWFSSIYPKLHVSINILLKKHHILTENEIPAIRSDFMDQTSNPSFYKFLIVILKESIASVLLCFNFVIEYKRPVKFYWRGRLSTIDLLILTSSDKFLFILKILLTSFTKQATLMRRSTVLSLPP
jgi:hypothetical protein